MPAEVPASRPADSVGRALLALSGLERLDKGVVSVDIGRET